MEDYEIPKLKEYNVLCLLNSSNILLQLRVITIQVYSQATD